MSLNQSLISDFSEYSRWSQKTNHSAVYILFLVFWDQREYSEKSEINDWFRLINHSAVYILFLMYGETFYDRHTAQQQLQWRQIKIKNELF